MRKPFYIAVIVVNAFFAGAAAYFFREALISGATRWGSMFGNVTNPIHRDQNPALFWVVTLLWCFTTLLITGIVIWGIRDVKKGKYMQNKTSEHISEGRERPSENAQR